VAGDRFLSATECYRSGRFDATLLRVLERYDAVMAVMLPCLAWPPVTGVS
jgi:lysyl-tRNA synthetase class 1